MALQSTETRQVMFHPHYGFPCNSLSFRAQIVALLSYLSEVSSQGLRKGTTTLSTDSEERTAIGIAIVYGLDVRGI